MRTYRELFATREFTPLFVTVSAQVAAATVSGLGLGTLVYAVTGSPLLAALSLFGASFGQLIGALTILSATDRIPPRAALTGVAVFLGLTTAVFAIPGLPIAALIPLVLVQGLVNSISGGARYGLLAEIVADDGYVLGRSLLNMSVGTMQIVGFAAGGLLVALVSARGAILTGAGLYLAAALLARIGLSARAPRASGRPSIRATWRGNRRLWAVPLQRYRYLALWVPNGLVVGCEALFVPYAPGFAGALFVAAALGMLAGDTLAGRFIPASRRGRLVTPFRLLLSVPYLGFALALPPWLAALAAAVASVGYCASLMLQEQLLAQTPDDLRGQALGLQSAGMVAMQAIGASLAGVVAQFVGPPRAIVAMAAASLAVSLVLTPLLRARRPTGFDVMGSSTPTASPARSTAGLRPR
jgi:MFS family permease